MVISRSWTLTGSATQSRRNGGQSLGGPFNAPGVGWTHSASAPASTPAYQQILDAATAAGATAVWNADDPNTWTLRESGGTQFYSATEDEKAALPDLTQSTETMQPDQVTLSTGARVWARTGGAERRMVTTAFTEISQPNTTLIVCRKGALGSGSDGQRFFDNAGIGSGRQIIWARNGTFQIWAGTLLSGPSEDTLWHIHQANFNGASSELFLEDTSVLSGNVGANNLTGAAIMNWSSASGALPDGSRVALVILFSTLKTNAELADLRAAIEDRYPIGVSE